MAPHRYIPACSRNPRSVQYALVALHRCVYVVVVVAVNADLSQCRYVNNDSDPRACTTQNRTRIMNFTAE